MLIWISTLTIYKTKEKKNAHFEIKHFLCVTQTIGQKVSNPEPVHPLKQDTRMRQCNVSELRGLNVTFEYHLDEAENVLEKSIQ